MGGNVELHQLLFFLKINTGCPKTILQKYVPEKFSLILSKYNFNKTNKKYCKT